jgi:hypothetical protein
MRRLFTGLDVLAMSRPRISSADRQHDQVGEDEREDGRRQPHRIVLILIGTV